MEGTYHKSREILPIFQYPATAIFGRVFPHSLAYCSLAADRGAPTAVLVPKCRAPLPPFDKAITSAKLKAARDPRELR
jgi:hypothetical protein